MSEFNFDWAEFAFGSKKPLKELDAIFIAAPRELSAKRFVQLVKEYLPKGNILLGISKEPHVVGFEGQPQFRMLAVNDELQKIIDLTNGKSPKNKIYTLAYSQPELKYIFEKVPFKHVLLVNGSWKYVFHASEAFYMLASQGASYAYISPFANEAEAIAYNDQVYPEMLAEQWPGEPTGVFSESEMLELADMVSKLSFDYSFQCGVTLGKKVKGKYEFVAATFNKVVPFQTYALHYGASREKNYSIPHDLNHYDTVHAEIAMIIRAATDQSVDLAGTTLFINLLPCPHCARALSLTDIEEFVYIQDHSAGYAVQLLEASGKKVRRAIPKEVAA